MTSNASLKDKIALVTGASRGIGQGIMQRLAQAGAIVIGTATTEQGAQAITEHVATVGRGRGYALNVTDRTSIDRVLQHISEEFGAGPAILVNNAGITRDNLLLRMKDEEWDSVIATNLTAIFSLTRACLRGMVKARYGRIISIGSVVGSGGNPGQANYCAAKAGVIGFSKSLAQEVASRGVTVNVVAPGFIATDMTHALSEDHKAVLLKQIPMQRMGAVADIAAAVHFFASEDASYITGTTLHVNGGMYMG